MVNKTTQQDFTYTYLEGRACKYCGKPIADQAHKINQFCSREVLPDGSIKSCKDDYHMEKRKERNAVFLQLMKFHQDVKYKLDSLVLEKGYQVSLAVLDTYGIRLDMPVQIIKQQSESPIFIFIGYAIHIIDSNTVKISTYDNKFQ